MGGKVTRASRPRAKGGLEICNLPDGCVVLDLEREQVHILNSSAAYVLSLCDGTRTREQIAAELTAAVPNLTSEQVRADVASALRQMVAKQLLAEPREG